MAAQQQRLEQVQTRVLRRILRLEQVCVTLPAGDYGG
jgi:hypothetical protein